MTIGNNSASAIADPLSDVLSRLESVKETSTGQYQAKCPAHDDRKASLCIARGDDGRVLLKCQAGCATIAVAAELGIKMADLFVPKGKTRPAKAAPTLGTVVATYDYHGPEGDLRFQCLRYEPKDFRQRRPDDNGGWVWSLKDVERVLYRLPDLNDADINFPVFIVEGEKDVDRLWSLGLVATCNPMGAGKWIRSYSETLRGRDVILIADNDEAGRDHVQEVAHSLNDIAASIRVLELPNLPPKGDVSDWLDAGGAPTDLITMAAETKLWDRSTAPPKTISQPPPPPSSPKAAANEPPVPKMMTDMGNAERFRDQHADRACYCHPLGYWYIQDGRRWKRDDTGASVRIAKKVTRAIWEEAVHEEGDRRDALLKWAKQSESADKIRKMLSLAQSELPVLTDQLDADAWLFNCRTGTIELRTGTLREHRPADLITKLAPVDYKGQSTPAPLWSQFIARITAGNDGLINYLQRLSGMFLTGDVSVQELFIFFGGGANGKSVFLDTIIGIMGDYAGSAANSLITGGRAEHPTELADLHGKRLVIASETEQDAHLRIQVVKQLTGNAKIKARFMRQDFFEFDRSHKLVLVTNSKPIVSEATHAVWRRLRLIPFDVTIPTGEQDAQLLDKLKAEWPGILGWMIRGCLAWQRGGLEPPPEVAVATENYRAEQDKLSEYIAERLVLQPGARLSRNDAFSDYASYCNQVSDKHPLDRNSFLDRLRRLPGVSESSTRLSGVNVRVFKGIGLSALQALQGASEESV